MTGNQTTPVELACDLFRFRWRRRSPSNPAAFEQRARPNHSADQERIARLEKKIQTKDEVLAELMADHVALKKSLGNSDRGLGSARHAGPDRGFHPALVGKNEISAGRFIA
jgi:hypothetical protein